ncbi:zinc finger SWIM domain protein [Methanolacinia petrolearia DSM 11571]|uniref:Zinc finger SWIM domain protein n=2 Tax=Methanolacinia TaxID=230355 RepID=E1RGR3_METP4|nr:zinc finger SWIM domain protein [Methanolacinia petrolearia DSM 11571]
MVTAMQGRFSPEEILLEETIESILKKYPQKGRKALDAVQDGKIHKYLDFFVVDGTSDTYVVDDDFCACNDFCFRGIMCWHILAVRIARLTGGYDEINEWYQDRWSVAGKNGGDTETDSNNNIS